MESKTLKVDLDLDSLYQNPAAFKDYVSAIHCMENYWYYAQYYVEKMDRDFKAIGEKYLSKMNYDYKDRLKRLKDAILCNQVFLNQIIYKYKPSPSYFSNISYQEIENYAKNEFSRLNYACFMYIIRDWTKENKEERELNYTPIINEVQKYIKPGSKILVPGGGLCRLSYEIGKLGYEVDINEYGVINLILCDFIFNNSQKDKYSFQPLIRCFNNFLKEDDIFKKYTFPDEDIKLEKGKLKMLPGDFTQILNGVNDFYECVVTCFFIDTAKNILEYIEIIERVLKKGGIWINFGPLSYHWTSSNEISIELPYDKLKETIINYGFEILSEDDNREINYCEIKDFLKNDYFRCVFFTAKKKE